MKSYTITIKNKEINLVNHILKLLKQERINDNNEIVIVDFQKGLLCYNKIYSKFLISVDSKFLILVDFKKGLQCHKF